MLAQPDRTRPGRWPRGERSSRARALVASLCGVLLCFLVIDASCARAATIAIPRPIGRVSDFAGVIDASTRASLDALLRELQAKTGAEIAVVTVKTTAPDDAFDYAMAIAEQWKPGDPKKDNGVVFLVAVDDRKVQILTGYGVEGPLPDGKVGEIRDRLALPAFRAGDYSSGIARATQALAAEIARDQGVTLSGVPPPVERRRARGGPPIAGILLIVGVLLALRFLGQGPRFGGGALPRRRMPGSGWGGWGGGGFGGPSGGFGGFGGGGGGGFGGFGGGRFGGGGAGGSW